MASNLATQLVRQASKEGARAISKAVFKKFTGEIAKGLLGMIQNMVSSYLGQLITETIFGELKETIIEKIQTNHEYLERKTNLSSNLIKLESLIGKPMAKNLLNENFIETERELDERINNQILSFTNQIGGPLAGQIGEAAGNVQFSGLKLNSKNQLKNMQHDELRKVADGISIALKVLSYSNAIFEMITIVGEMLKSIQFDYSVFCVKLLSNDFIAAGLCNGEIVIYDLNKMENAITILAHSKVLVKIKTLNLLSNGDLLCGSDNGEIKIFNLFK